MQELHPGGSVQCTVLLTIARKRISSKAKPGAVFNYSIHPHDSVFIIPDLRFSMIPDLRQVRVSMIPDFRQVGFLSFRTLGKLELGW